jgi:hypothetical protein
MNKLLITFGCSWTFGVSVGYTSGMSDAELRKIWTNRDLADKYSFRGILTKKYDFTNINFSLPGSSNQKQFRIAKAFFNSNQFKNIQSKFDQIVVLWGITSTARNEMFIVKEQILKNFFYNSSTLLDPFIKSMVKFSYDHAHEVFSLATDMAHWNMFFNNLGIKNLWFDTFNHHDYTTSSPGILEFSQQYNVMAGPDWPSWNQYLTKQFHIKTSPQIEAFRKVFGIKKSITTPVEYLNKGKN